MAAAIAIIKTAPAARSFVFFIISLYSGETKSANDSMDELIASADNTAPITITTAIHSVWDKPKKKPAITTQIAAKQCIHALCSFFILFIVLRERDKDTNNTSKTDTMFIFGHCCLEHVADNQLYIFLA